MNGSSVMLKLDYFNTVSVAGKHLQLSLFAILAPQTGHCSSTLLKQTANKRCPRGHFATKFSFTIMTWRKLPPPTTHTSLIEDFRQGCSQSMLSGDHNKKLVGHSVTVNQLFFCRLEVRLRFVSLSPFSLVNV